MKTPSTEQDWKHISDDFEKLWKLPHVLGVIDGKHFGMDCPKRSGSKYHNYKDFFSMVIYWQFAMFAITLPLLMLDSTGQSTIVF